MTVHSRGKRAPPKSLKDQLHLDCLVGVLKIEPSNSFLVEGDSIQNTGLLQIRRTEMLHELLTTASELNNCECENAHWRDGDDEDELSVRSFGSTDTLLSFEDDNSHDLAMVRSNHSADHDWVLDDSGPFGETDSLHTRRSVRMLLHKLDGIDSERVPQTVTTKSAHNQSFKSNETNGPQPGDESKSSASTSMSVRTYVSADDSEKGVASINTPIPNLPMQCPSPDARAA